MSILKTLQELVPRHPVDVDVNVDDDEVVDTSTKHTLHRILVGGDQLSTSMACRVITDRINSTDDIQSLKGSGRLAH